MRFNEAIPSNAAIEEDNKVAVVAAVTANFLNDSYLLCRGESVRRMAVSINRMPIAAAPKLTEMNGEKKANKKSIWKRSQIETGNKNVARMEEKRERGKKNTEKKIRKE